MNCDDVSSCTDATSFSGEMIACFSCHVWLRNVFSSTSFHAGILRQNSSVRSCRCVSVCSSTGGFLWWMVGLPSTTARVLVMGSLGCGGETGGDYGDARSPSDHVRAMKHDAAKPHARRVTGAFRPDNPMGA